MVKRENQRPEGVPVTHATLAFHLACRRLTHNRQVHLFRSVQTEPPAARTNRGEHGQVLRAQRINMASQALDGFQQCVCRFGPQRSARSRTYTLF